MVQLFKLEIKTTMLSHDFTNSYRLLAFPMMFSCSALVLISQLLHCHPPIPTGLRQMLGLVRYLTFTLLLLCVSLFNVTYSLYCKLSTIYFFICYPWYFMNQVLFVSFSVPCIESLQE